MLRKFGFRTDFVSLIGRMHEDTTARFAVNGELYAVMRVRSGIRQGCPLAPLLFIIAAEALGLMLDGDDKLQGISVPGTDGATKWPRSWMTQRCISGARSKPPTTPSA